MLHSCILYISTLYTLRYVNDILAFEMRTRALQRNVSEIKWNWMTHLSSWSRASPWAIVDWQASRLLSLCWAVCSRRRSVASRLSARLSSACSSCLSSSTHVPSWKVQTHRKLAYEVSCYVISNVRGDYQCLRWLKFKIIQVDKQRINKCS